MLFSSCDSALSDVELEDPSLIHPYIMAIREILPDNEVNYRFEAWIYDKNYNLVELKKGYVRLDGEEMGKDSVYISFINDLGFHVENGKYYIAPEGFGDIVFDTQYDVEIELSDEEVYNSYVITHDEPFVSTAVSETHIQGEDMRIHWAVVNDYKMRVKLRYTVEENDGPHRYAYSTTIPEDSLLTGSFTIDGENFNMVNDEYEAIIRLENWKPGVMNVELGEYSDINSIHAVEKLCIVYPLEN
jgi:hypothetical protein